ncbi:MAG: hypothetical protein KAI16_01905 [Candidatus Pacebacteria bacterium]|nr:hypothetical protein [Candidatus Paceibacterota bacterium]
MINKENTRNVARRFNRKNFFRKIVRLLLILFTVGAISYGLIWVPYLTLKINVQNSNINFASAFRNCEVMARQDLVKIVEEAKKVEKEYSDEEKINILNNLNNNCLYLRGLYNPPQVESGEQVEQEAQEVQKIQEIQEVQEVQQEEVVIE